MRQVSVQDIGPIESLTFPVPEKGGVVVLQSRNGKGKSTVLEAVDALATKRGAKDLQHRDGVTVGSVEAFGARMTVARRASRAGELEVTSLEGRFSVLDLVEPGIIDGAAADAKRIKALVQLAGGAGASPEPFYKLVGGKEAFDEYVSAKATNAPDLVNMAAAVKRDLEAKARQLEEEAKKESVRAQSARAAVDGIDLTAPDDAVKLHEDLKLAIAEEARLKAEARAALDAQYKAEEARKALTSAEASHPADSLSLAEKRLENERIEQRHLLTVIEEIKGQLARAEADLRASNARVEAMEGAVIAAQAHEQTLTQWRAAVEAGKATETVTDEQLAEARADVEAAQAACDLGTRVRDAKAKVEQADAHAQMSAHLHTQADKLREAARGTDNVLSEIVATLGCPLRVSRGGRLVTDTARGETLFSELSRGEQWKLALDIAIEAVGPGGLLVINQEGWEGLDPENRALIAQHVEGTGVVILTAEATGDEELKAEVFQAA